MKQRYEASDRTGRKSLLDEMAAVTGKHRKSLIRLMNGSLERKPRKAQRGRLYGPEVDDAIRVISESLDYICAERLTPALATTARQLARHGEVLVTPTLLEQLERISISTVQRILKRIGQDQRRRSRRRPPGTTNTVAREIPAGRIDWDEKQPGHFEVDLVHHCGPITSGNFMHTLQIIDVATGWSERVAALGRSSLVMADAFQRLLHRLPLPIIELHPDNGSEFLNRDLIHFWEQVFPGVHISRSFPYHKNDNRFVEQKNSTLVRQYLGYDRLDSVAQVNLANQLYDKLWLYNNFFQPVMRLQEKTPVVSEDGTHTRRRYDIAQTPFDRLCQTGAISIELRNQLSRQRDQTNPRQLREEIYALIDRIFQLPNLPPGEFEDVALTLFIPVFDSVEPVAP
ncbi:MAG: transposase family protein [Veillonellaceae bacterium]|nr:transposase family protein [Veillonellaceae bacterium]